MHDVMERVPRAHPEAGIQRVGGHWMVAGPDDQLHTFEDHAGAASEVAERIIELCDGHRTVAQIVDCLCSEFEVQSDACAHDTAAFVKLLVDKQVLVWG